MSHRARECCGKFLRRNRPYGHLICLSRATQIIVAYGPNGERVEHDRSCDRHALPAVLDTFAPRAGWLIRWEPLPTALQGGSPHR